MNPLLALLMAASATAADPAPVVKSPAPPVITYTYADPGSVPTTEDSRPRLFSRLRNFFRRRSQPADQWPATSYPAPSSGVAGSNVWGTMPPATAGSSQAGSAGTSNTPVLRPVPAPQPETSPAKKLPSGSPF